MKNRKNRRALEQITANVLREADGRELVGVMSAVLVKVGDSGAKPIVRYSMNGNVSDSVMVELLRWIADEIEAGRAIDGRDPPTTGGATRLPGPSAN